jgi:hypothetical protein
MTELRTAKLHFRPDGSVSGVFLTEAVTYEAGGKTRQIEEDREGTLDELSGILGEGVVAAEARIAELEEQIQRERDEAKVVLETREKELTEVHVRAQAETENKLREEMKIAGDKAASDIAARDEAIEFHKKLGALLADRVQKVAALAVAPLEAPPTLAPSSPVGDISVADPATVR